MSIQREGFFDDVRHTAAAPSDADSFCLRSLLKLDEEEEEEQKRAPSPPPPMLGPNADQVDTQIKANRLTRAIANNGIPSSAIGIVHLPKRQLVHEGTTHGFVSINLKQLPEFRPVQFLTALTRETRNHISIVRAVLNSDPVPILQLQWIGSVSTERQLFRTTTTSVLSKKRNSSNAPEHSQKKRSSSNAPAEHSQKKRSTTVTESQEDTKEEHEEPESLSDYNQSLLLPLHELARLERIVHVCKTLFPAAPSGNNNVHARRIDHERVCVKVVLPLLTDIAVDWMNAVNTIQATLKDTDIFLETETRHFCVRWQLE
jgi:hypothetical protein